MGMSLEEAHIPMWLKIKLAQAARGGEGSSYEDVGWHLGYHHIDTFDLDEADVLNVDEEDFRQPTATLRKLFASEEHPEAGFVDLIPVRHRRAFLRGLVNGAAGYTEEE